MEALKNVGQNCFAVSKEGEEINLALDAQVQSFRNFCYKDLEDMTADQISWVIYLNNSKK
jgi:hypothetical protein